MRWWKAVLVVLGLRSLPLIDDDTEYPPFKLDSSCPKCGYKGTSGNRDGHSAWFVGARTEVRGAFRVSFPECIKRHCFRCGADWFELPVDAGKAAS